MGLVDRGPVVFVLQMLSLEDVAAVVKVVDTVFHACLTPELLPVPHGPAHARVIIKTARLAAAFSGMMVSSPAFFSAAGD
jgi:hypothetical protein